MATPPTTSTATTATTPSAAGRTTEAAARIGGIKTTASTRSTWTAATATRTTPVAAGGQSQQQQQRLPPFHHLLQPPPTDPPQVITIPQNNVQEESAAGYRSWESTQQRQEPEWAGSGQSRPTTVAAPATTPTSQRGSSSTASTADAATAGETGRRAGRSYAAAATSTAYTPAPRTTTIGTVRPQTATQKHVDGWQRPPGPKGCGAGAAETPPYRTVVPPPEARQPPAYYPYYPYNPYNPYYNNNGVPPRMTQQQLQDRQLLLQRAETLRRARLQREQEALQERNRQAREAELQRLRQMQDKTVCAGAAFGAAACAAAMDAELKRRELADLCQRQARLGASSIQDSPSSSSSPPPRGATDMEATIFETPQLGEVKLRFATRPAAGETGIAHVFDVRSGFPFFQHHARFQVDGTAQSQEAAQMEAPAEAHAHKGRSLLPRMADPQRPPPRTARRGGPGSPPAARTEGRDPVSAPARRAHGTSRHRLTIPPPVALRPRTGKEAAERRRPPRGQDEDSRPRRRWR